MLKTFFLCVFISVFIPSLWAEEKGEAQKQEEKKEEGKDNNSEKGLPDTSNYFYNKSVFKLSPFMISIFKNGDVESIVQIECAMQATEENWDKLRFQIPLLYHHIFVDLYQSLNFLWDRSTPPSAEVLKKRMMTVSNRVLGEGKIKNVLIGVISVTPRPIA